MEKLPAQTGEIFEILSKAQFICSDSVNDRVRVLYDVINENETLFYDYFIAINFILERGDEYFFFAKKELKADLDRKLETVFRWIDILDFLKAFNNAFVTGYRFSPSDLEVKTRVDVMLKDKLDGLKRHLGETGSLSEKINKLVNLLVKEGWIELENEINNQYKVVAAFKYAEQLVASINIPEDIQNEIPE